MKKSKFWFHLLFNKERHLLSSFLFAFLFSVLFTFVYSIQNYPLQESLSHHKEMDQNCFIVMPQTESKVLEQDLDVTTSLSYAESVYQEMISNAFYKDRVQSYDVGIRVGLDLPAVHDNHQMFGELLYVDPNYNLNNFGDFHLRDDNRNTCFCFTDKALTQTEIMRLPGGQFIPVENKDETWFCFDATYVCRTKEAFHYIYSNASGTGYGREVRVSYFYTIHLKDAFTIRDAKKLLIQSSDQDILTQDYERVFNAYQDSQRNYQYYLCEQLSQNLLLLLALFLPVFLACLFLSDGIQFRKKEKLYLALDSFGISKEKIALVQLSSAFIASLFGFIAYTVLYFLTDIISNHVVGFTFLNGLYFLVPLCCLILVCLEKFFVFFVFTNKKDRKK